MRRKSLFAATVIALSMLAVASSALAVTEDKLVDVSGGSTIPAGRDLHFVGWVELNAVNGTGGMKCHVTVVATVTGNTGTTAHIKAITADTSKCTGTGFFTLLGCNELTSHLATATDAKGEHIWDVTATEKDFEVFNVEKEIVEGKEVNKQMVVHLRPKGACVLAGAEITMTIPSITLKPLNTTDKAAATNTLGNLGATAATGEAIAGVEVSGTGKAHTPGSELAVLVSGEFELTDADRCTWKFAA